LAGKRASIPDARVHTREFVKDPRPERNLALLIFLLGVAGVLYWFLRHSPTAILPDLVGIAAVVAVQLGMVFFLINAFDARRYARLKSGKTEIARWMLSPDEWHAFITRSSAVGRAPDGLSFGIPRGQWPRTEPVEIVVGSDGVLIDGDFNSLVHGVQGVAPPVWVEGVPPFLEFTVWEPGAHDSDGTLFAVRIPVAANSRWDAKRVQKHYESVLPPLRRKDRSAT
jgi:hypothetical protein